MESIPQLIIAAAQRHSMDPRLAVEVAVQESRLNQAAVSSAGAIGIFQLMPTTARSLGVDPYDLRQNIDGGVRYLSQQLSRFGDVGQALGAYNWGPSRVTEAVSKWGADWLSHAPAETRNYVSSILARVGQEWQQQPLVTAQTVEKAQAAVSRFQGLTQPQQTAILLLGLGLGIFWLSGVFSDE